MLALRSLVGRAKRQVVADLRSDPYLVAVLAVAFALSAFFFWHELPNFATWDERDRILDPLVAYGRVIDDPSLGALREGVLWGRQPFGATFYLYAIALLPVVLAAFVLGDIGSIAALGLPTEEFGFWETWHATPEWIWTWSLLITRFLNVCFAVGSVYLTYRIGTYLRNRGTGRLAAAFFSVTWGLITLAHEAGEDVPSVFVLLLALYLLVQYVETGTNQRLFEASAVGAAALTLKMTIAPIVFVIAIAHLLRTYREGGTWRTAVDVDSQDLLAKGAWIGLAVIILGFPTLLVGGVLDFVIRIFGHPAHRVAAVNGPSGPIWWWFLRGYFTAFGLPLFVASVIGTVAGVVRFRRRLPDVDASGVLLAFLGLYLFMLVGFRDFRPHHLLPTLPLMLIFLSAALIRLRERRRTVARAAIAVLLVTSGAYAAVGSAGYASTPRAEAVDWMDDNVDRNATMEFYTRGFEEAAVPHWIDAQYPYAGDKSWQIEPCPEYVQLTHRDLLYLRDIPMNQRSRFVRENTAARAEHVRSLLNGSYDYEIVKEFGDRPPNFVPDRPKTGSFTELLPLGIYPQSDQYSDEQELQANQYVVILRYNGTCEESLPRPD